MFILVPDRDAVSAERRASVADGAGLIDVVTFRRLSNYIFRKLGGICERYVGAGEKKVIMHSVLADLSKKLAEYGKISPSDLSMTETLVGARSEMMRNMITPTDLGEGARKLSGRTADKLADLSAIFSEFDKRISEKWSDPDGMLSVACEKEGVTEYFSGRDVYIDAFTAFTAQQYRMIEIIMRGAENVCVSVAYEPDGDANEPAFMTVGNTDRLLRETAVRAGAKIGEDTVKRVPTRFESAELSFLSANMWSSSRRVRVSYDGKCDAVKVVCAANAYAEAEAVATDICRRIHGGMRYRDIAVVTRSTEEYGGIIDAVFDKYEIPYFISKKTDITEFSLIKFVFVALGMCEHGMIADDVISYIKTDLPGIDQKDAFAFENYVIKWSVSGKRFYEGDFVMNPRGIGERFTDADVKKLDVINSVRRDVTEPLLRFFGVMKNARDVRGKATALFDFLSELGVPERLGELAEKAREAGDASHETMLKQLWRAFCDALDGLVTAIGERKCTLDEFTVYLRAMLSKTEIGAIPTSVDEVLIADAVLTGVSGAKAVYVIGCYEGGFPKKVGDEGIFTEREKSELESAGIEISSRIWKKISDEMYYFYAAASSASKFLTFTYPRADAEGTKTYRSLGVMRVLELFPELEVYEFESATDADMIWNKRASFEYAVLNKGALGAALREYYDEDPEFKSKLKAADTPMSASKCEIDPEAAKELFKNKLNTSPSQIDKYVNCPFSYFCKYQLALADDGVQRFEAVDAGSFMHKIMEVCTSVVTNDPAIDEEKTKKIISDAADAEMDRMFCGAVPPHMDRIKDYLCKYAEKFMEKIKSDVAASKFKPYGYEIVIGSEGIEPMTLSNDEISVRIKGKIDRVDAYAGGDGTLHVLVCDYKTGQKKFEMKNVELGLDLQMLLYMFSVWENGEEFFGQKPTPAGVMYIGIRPKNLDLTVSGTAAAEIVKSGVFTSDASVLRALDPALDGEVIPVTLKDIEDFASGENVAALVSPEGMNELKTKVKKTVLDIAKDICGGKAPAKPIKEGSGSPCRYCEYRAVCRRMSADEEDEE